MYPGTIQDGGQLTTTLALVVTPGGVVGLNCFGFAGEICPGDQPNDQWRQHINHTDNRIPNPVTTSEKQRMQEQRYKEDSFNLLAFLKDADWVTFDRNGSVTSRELYAGYQQWCSVNGEEPLAQRTVSSYLKSNAKQLDIRASEHMVNRTGIRARGYKGITIRDLIPIAI